MLGIPREWVHKQPERFKEATQKVYEQEKILVSIYDGFINQGRRVLKV